MLKLLLFFGELLAVLLLVGCRAPGWRVLGPVRGLALVCLLLSQTLLTLEFLFLIGLLLLSGGRLVILVLHCELQLTKKVAIELSWLAWAVLLLALIIILHNRLERWPL